MSRILRWLFVIGAVLYAGYGAVMVWLHPQFIYPFSQQPFAGDGYARVELPVEGDSPLAVHVYEGQADHPVILYFMGNVGALELFRPMLDHHKDSGRGVVGMTYRGGGGEAGTPSETVLKRDALATFDATRARFPDRAIIIQGYSLGTGIATYVASQRDAKGLILSAPFTRMCSLMTAASGLPACFLPVQRWDSVADALAVRMPVLVLHGTADSLIPFEHSEALMQVFNGAGIEADLVAIRSAGHTNLTQFPGYLNAIDRFVSR